jgi:hypothetical protein
VEIHRAQLCNSLFRRFHHRRGGSHDSRLGPTAGERGILDICGSALGIAGAPSGTHPARD